MPFFDSTLLHSDSYWLTNVHVPAALLTGASSDITDRQTREGLCAVHLLIHKGAIGGYISANSVLDTAHPSFNGHQGIVLPCFVDMHTHLDKGHIWERSPNLSGTFDEALSLVRQDAQKNWNAEDVYRRMTFGLQCSYAHGTSAIRTHLDSFGQQGHISFEVFRSLQQEWSDRIALQAVSLVPIDYFATQEGERLADCVAATKGGVLGGLVLMHKDIDRQLDRVFEVASDRQLDLDFHTDESGDPNDMTLRHVAAAALRHGYEGRVVCGHCCSLAVQPQAEVEETIALVKEARVGIVSLPMCNLFLQDRNQFVSQRWVMELPDAITRTPRWRGITLLHELKQAGISVAVASDNCRDPFFGFGDHDMLEVFVQSVRIAHLDAPYGNWCSTVTTTPASLLGMPASGKIEVGLSADFILFKARRFSELLARHQSDRVVIRRGKAIDTTLPDYAELDDLLV